MVVRRRVRAVLIPLAAYAFAACLVAYFIHHARIGNRGSTAKQALKIQIYEVNRELAAVKEERAEWEQRLALLRADRIDPDLLEERARVLLGRVHKNDIVVIAP